MWQRLWLQWLFKREETWPKRQKQTCEACCSCTCRAAAHASKLEAAGEVKGHRLQQQQASPDKHKMTQVSDKYCLFHRLQNLRSYDGICRWSALTLVRPSLCSSDQRRRRDWKKEEWFSVTASQRATVYLCDSAGPREMHDDRQDIYGGLRSGICLCAWCMGLSHNLFHNLANLLLLYWIFNWRQISI